VIVILFVVLVESGAGAREQVRAIARELTEAAQKNDYAA